MEPLDDSEATRVGPYRLLAELGHGGMGRVLLGAAHDGRLAAVKLVHARFASDADFRARFRREVAASRRVSGAYTAAVMDADADAELPWLASVFVTGPSLGSVVREAGPLPEAAVRRLALGLATALVEIHRVGLIHRDLKPENVLLAEDGVRVIDFGIARAAEPGGGAEPTRLTQTGWVIGSPPFMSPEQAESRELTPASDVFSLGAILVLALTGDSPFAGTSTFRILSNVVHGVPDLSGVPAGLRGIVEACLAKDPTARPTPARLIELLGPVAPAARVWPPAVHTMVAEQQARIAALLDGPPGREPTLVVPPSRPPVEAPTPTPLSTPASASTPAGATTADPAPAAVPVASATAAPAVSPAAVSDSPAASSPTSPAAAPAPDSPAAMATVTAPGRVPTTAPDAPPPPPAPRRRRGRTLALVTAGVLVVAGAGVGGYFLLRPAGDTYRTLPTCAESAFRLPSYERETERDFSVVRAEGPETRCFWSAGKPDDKNGKAAEIWWNLKLPTGTKGAATDRQRADFAEQSTGGRAADLAFGDEAYWAPPSAYEDCSLQVRDGNLVVRAAVSYGDDVADPARTCEPEAVQIAERALAALR
ncbi:serine/threonine-protein kinase [Streptomyces sp. NPDC093089]|uniref:serine/threonine-protein kinase n=1 Tax=Streptomyces sp. NPDC093089 TaxID=3366024 RepID=UPI0037F80B32